MWTIHLRHTSRYAVLCTTVNVTKNYIRRASAKNCPCSKKCSSRGFRRFIDNAFKDHPIITNSVIYGTLYVSAEFVQQTISKKLLSDPSEDYDFASLRNFGVMGTLYYPVIFYYWYSWLDSAFCGTSMKVILRKILLDQFIMTLPALAGFFVGLSILEQKDDIFAELKEKFLKTFATSCVFWLPAQVVNFSFIPNRYRITYIALCAFVWINILSYIKHYGFSGAPPPKKKKK